MKESHVIEILHAVEMVVLQQTKDGSFNILGKNPSWFQSCCSAKLKSGQGYYPAKEFPYLKNFLKDSKTFHKTKSGDTLKRKSGWWTEIGENDKTHYLQATASCINNINYLIIEHATPSTEIFGLLQKYRESILQFEYNKDMQDEVTTTTDIATDLSLEDNLTGLHNQRAFVLLADQQKKMARRKKVATLFMMLDIGNLGEIISKYGAKEGTLAIKITAKILKRTFRKTDVIAKFENGIFAILALEIAQHAAKIMIDRLKERLDKYNKTSFKTYDIAISCGIVKYDYNHPAAIKELIQIAGFRLNENKIAGKII